MDELAATFDLAAVVYKVLLDDSVDLYRQVSESSSRVKKANIESFAPSHQMIIHTDPT